VHVAGVLLAAGSGRRLGLGVPKALCLLDGVPLLGWAARSLVDSGAIDRLVVVAPPGAEREAREVLDACVPRHGAVVVTGADSRHGSLHAAIDALDRRVSTVVVHDACRPLAPADVVVRALQAVHDGADLAVPVIEVTETVKELDPTGRIARTVPRETVVRVQTPQAVRRHVLDAAHGGCRGAGFAAVAGDEQGALAPPDARMSLVDGEDDGFPVVRPNDLAFAEAVLARRRAAG